MSRETKARLCSLSRTKDMSKSGDNRTIETTTFIADDESKPSSMKEGVQARGVGEQWRCDVVSCVCVCLQVTNSMGESDSECKGGLMSTCECVDQSENSQSISRRVSRCLERNVEAIMGLVSENVWLVYGRQLESKSNTRNT
jgi:hypothetical protein